jgi:hypothetical protein
LSDEKPDIASEIEEDLRTVWQRLSLKQLRWVLVVVVLVITAAFGGLKTAQHVTLISFGQTYTAGGVRVTPHSVSVTDHRIGLPRLSPECRYLVLTATIQNIAKESIPFPIGGGSTNGDDADSCAPEKLRDTELFQVTGIPTQFWGTFRGNESIIVPSIESGFTYDYSVAWAVSLADLRRHPRIVIRIHNMYSFISTFVIAHYWVGDPARYAELPISNLELS